MSFINKLFGKSDAITVSFINNATGELIGTSKMQPKDLPETFSIATTMSLHDTDWSVTEAIPQNSADFIKAGELTLKLSKVETMNTADFLFTLPTISNEWPKTTITPFNAGPETVIHEDDWRQNEFLNVTSEAHAEIEILKIKDIWENHNKTIDDSFTAFAKCHPRDTIGEPSLAIALESLKQLLNVSIIGNLKLAIGAFVENGISFKTENTTYYGVVQNGIITHLCVSDFCEDTLQEIQQINKAYNLFFINWYHHELIY